MNKLIPVAVVAIFIVLGIVLWSAVNDTGTPDVGALPVAGDPPLPKTDNAIRDNATETLRTLTELQSRTQKNLDALTEKQSTALAENKGLKTKVDSLKSQLNQRLDALKEEIKSSAATPPESGVSSGMPSGLGYDNFSVMGSGTAGVDSYPVTPPADEYVSVMPVGGTAPGVTTGKGFLDKVSDSVDGLLKTPVSQANNSKNGKGSDQSKEQTKIKAFTINSQATLVANTTMTALMGKVPNKNNVVDPFRFKIITGADNLAASGLHLPPGIEQIVSSGYSVGNREMSCVRGWIDTVTLVFQDGTIATETTRNKTNNTKSVKSLGYISDPWGKPCINGKLFSNADDYLKDRAFMATLAAVADAAASAESSTIVTGDSFASAITGDKGDYILGKSVAGFSDELLAFFRDRMANAFDVIFIPTGVQLSLHIEQEIQFDYDPNGRKIDHGFNLQVSKNRQLD